MRRRGLIYMPRKKRIPSIRDITAPALTDPRMNRDAGEPVLTGELSHYANQFSVGGYDGSLDGLCSIMKNEGETVLDVRYKIVQLLNSDPDMVPFTDAAERHRKRGGKYPEMDLILKQSHMTRAQVVGGIARALSENNMAFERIILALNGPRVMAALVNGAAHPEGTTDRNAFLKIRGHLAQPSGTTVNVSAVAQSKAESVQVLETGRALPRFEEDVRETVQAIRSVKRIAD